jgi:hypothetical protein
MNSERTCNVVKEYTNEELRGLLQELKEIGKSDTPNHVKKSDKLSYLCEIEKTVYSHWAMQYVEVCNAIETEILHRVVGNKW